MIAIILALAKCIFLMCLWAITCGFILCVTLFTMAHIVDFIMEKLFHYRYPRWIDYITATILFIISAWFSISVCNELFGF